MTGVLGEPGDLQTGCLPTKKSVYNLYKKILDDMIKSGQWKQGNVKTAEIAKLVSKEVSVQWGKTDIPTLFTIIGRLKKK